MFKRKKQPAPQARPPHSLPPRPTPSVVHRKSRVKLTVSECLQQAQGGLQKLRSINPGDLQAFPLLNEVQRLVQQLKEATASLPPADREAWSFQIAELEEDFRELADLVVSRADAAPKPEPRLASPSNSSNASAGGRSPMTSTLLSPSSSGRVQQAIALFSRQEGFTAGSQAAGTRRVHTSYPNQRSQQLQGTQQPHTQVPQSLQIQQQFYQQQQHEKYLQHQAVEHAYPQATSSLASTPVRSDSSFMYLTEEERELLAQKQQMLLQKHLTYLTQQRDAEEQVHGAASRGIHTASVQQIGSHGVPLGMLAQHAQASVQATYYAQQRGPPFEYGSAQATPHADAKETVAAAAYNQQQQRGAYQDMRPGVDLPQQQLTAKHVVVEGGGPEEDLFSGLDIVATDEQQSSLPQEGETAQIEANALIQQLQPAAMGAVTAATNAGVQAVDAGTQRDALAPQRVATYSFRPAAHSVPHRMYAGSQMGSTLEGASLPQQDAAGNGAPGQSHYSQPDSALQNAQQQQGMTELLQNPAQHDMQQQQYPSQHQHSASAQGYVHAEVGTSIEPARSSPFSQATSPPGPAASTLAVSDVSSVSYPIRKKTAHVKLGYGVEESAISQRLTPPQQQGTSLTLLGAYAELQMVAGNVPVEAATRTEIVGRVGPGVEVQGQFLVPAEGFPQQDSLATNQGPWSQQELQLQQQRQLMPVLLQRPASRTESVWQQQQHLSRPTTPAYNAIAAGRDQGVTVPEAPLQGSICGLQSTQQQQNFPDQQEQRHLRQVPGAHHLADAAPIRYPQVNAQEDVHALPAQQLPQQPQSKYTVQHLGHYPQVWPGDSVQYASQHAQLPHNPLHPQLRYQPTQTQQLHHLQHVQQETQPVQHLQEHTEQNTQSQQQNLQQLQPQQQLHAQMPLWQGQDMEDRAPGQHQQFGGRQTPAKLPKGALHGQRYYHSVELSAEESSSGYLHINGMATGNLQKHGLSPLQPEVPDAAVADQTVVCKEWPLQPSTQSPASLAVDLCGHQGGALENDPAAADVAMAPVAAPLASTSTAGEVSNAAAPTARPSPYLSAFLQYSQSGVLDGSNPGDATNRPPVATASASPTPTGSAKPTAAFVNTAPASTTVRPTTTMVATFPLAQSAAAADTSTPTVVGCSAAPPTMNSVLSLPLSSGTLRSRSRGLVSGGGGNTSCGIGPDPAASLPALLSLPTPADLESFLDSITGPVDACRAAAEQRAREMVSALAAAMSQVQKVESSVQQQRRAVKAALSGVMASIAHLESDQAAAVENEDFVTAATLDEQLTQLMYRRTNMEEQVRLLAEGLQRASALRLQVLSQQAELWRITGRYLSRLQSGQQQMAATLAAQAEREAAAAAMLHHAAQEALTQRRSVLEGRTAELEATSADVAAKIAAATAPADAERQRRATIRDALEADVESLRALLAAKEAALAAAEAAVVEAAELVRRQAVTFDPDLVRMEEARRQLEAEAAHVAGHEQALQESERQAAARAAAVEEHQSQLKLQADALGAAAAAMQSETEALTQRMAVEARNQEQRERLLQADEKAREDLKGLERCISDLSADLSRLAEQRGKLAVERAAAQEVLVSLQRSLPELEAAKRAAAASKDFREAARLSGELRALSAQADMAAAQLARLSGSLSELAAIESGKVSELEELRAMVHDAQRHAAEAHHRYLAFSLRLSRAALEEAAAAELYEEAGALQAEVAAEEAEALALERAWGFARPQASAAAAAAVASASAAARRRTSLEASSTSTAAPHLHPQLHSQLQAQISRQSLGGLSTQSSRSLSSQLPAASAAAAVAGLRPFPSVGGGTTALHTGSTVHVAGQQSLPQYQPQLLHAYQQQLPQHQMPVSPVCDKSWSKHDGNDTGGLGDGIGISGQGLLAAISSSPPLLSPQLYFPTRPQSPPAATPPSGGPSLYNTVPTDDPRVVTTGASPVNDSVLAAAAYSTSSVTSPESDAPAAHQGSQSPQRPPYIPLLELVATSSPHGAAGNSSGLHGNPSKRSLLTDGSSSSSAHGTLPTHQAGDVTANDSDLAKRDDGRCGETRPLNAVANVTWAPVAEAATVPPDPHKQDTAELNHKAAANSAADARGPTTLGANNLFAAAALPQQKNEGLFGEQGDMAGAEQDDELCRNNQETPGQASFTTAVAEAAEFTDSKSSASRC
ncbi:hypothetical protein VaNZ11_010783 [Volvox africanus]|uniref:Uncharacterized protein n=1 Tax=Volvox africanus TaxID=51714 RepID=A0ABQ5SBI6_9CHLO|nr:hypothetical protein VaNZ11_010783 [Volvox africanus]